MVYTKVTIVSVTLDRSSTSTHGVVSTFFSVGSGLCSGLLLEMEGPIVLWTSGQLCCSITSSCPWTCMFLSWPLSVVKHPRAEVLGPQCVLDPLMVLVFLSAKVLAPSGWLTMSHFTYLCMSH